LGHEFSPNRGDRASATTGLRKPNKSKMSAAALAMQENSCTARWRGCFQAY
jgi:hypothetical protein